MSFSYINIFLYLLVFCVAFLGLLLVIVVSKKYQLFIDSSSSNKPQRFHYSPTPRAGGIGILLGVIVGICAFFGISGYWLCFLLGGIVVFMSGFIEDIGTALSPKIRLFIQCLGAGIACIGMDEWLRGLALGFEFNYVFGVLFSIFAIVGVCNAMNIIDGFNGLSGGVGLSVCLSIVIVCMQAEMPDIAIMAIVLGSAILGFLVLNFPNGKIFLGDGGAYFLGFALAMILIILSQRPASIVSPWYGFCVMIYPVWEVLFSILRKKIAKRPATQPDSFHFHMLLFKKLHNNPLTSLIIVCANIPFIALATLFYANTFVLMITSLVFILVYGITYFRLKS